MTERETNERDFLMERWGRWGGASPNMKVWKEEREEGNDVMKISVSKRIFIEEPG